MEIRNAQRIHQEWQIIDQVLILCGCQTTADASGCQRMPADASGCQRITASGHPPKLPAVTTAPIHLISFEF